jgi:predicted enzyme related to lactoylglutathione lyase
VPNAFVYCQLSTTDHSKAKEFYRTLFGWRLEESLPGAPEYTEIYANDGPPSGGMRPSPNPHAPSQWLPFVEVTDVATATERARALGATVVVEPSDVPQKGRYSVVVDPTGAVFALWTPHR